MKMMPFQERNWSVQSPHYFLFISSHVVLWLGEPQGPCPSGVMEIRLSQMPCPGFDATNAIQIEYSINRGTQKSYHDNPGQYFMGTRRVAYLPNNDDGLRLLARLKYAWRRGLTFSVGTSLTTGMSNVVVWSSIHHKTSLHGGPHSFPDPNYLNNCNGSLDALYVPDPDTCLQKLASVATDVIENVTRRGVPSSPSRMPRVNDTRQEIIPYDAPVSFASSPSVTAALAISKKVDCDCSICLDPLNKGSVIQIQKCGHTFHKKCLEDCLDSQPLCPICREPVGLQGMSPSGTMAVNFINQTCPGFACTSTIQINYFIPPGIQKSYHENPGMRHGSTTRMAYLPNNGEGKSILTRLKYAWKHGLTFNIGTSLTTGERNVVVWAGIPHKTSLRGGLYGFPDNTYFAQCHSSLAAAGVPNEDACV